MEKTTLADLGRGQSALVVAIEGSGELSDALRDLGLAPGAVIYCLRPAPLGDPVAYWLAGSAVALRRDDARRVRISMLPQGYDLPAQP